jgi:alkylhydroperoxidase/carboxymuconolactone decarboxylase family protein YurZ
VASNARTHRRREDFYGGDERKFEIVKEHDPEFVDLLAADRDFALQEGAIPAKYKMLMTMIVDALLAHDSGVAVIADRARGLGASEDEIREAVV